MNIDDNHENGRITAIVLAAGKGSRMHSEVPKQFMELCGHPVLYYSLKAFQDSKADDIVLVTSEEYIDYCKTNIVDRYGLDKIRCIVPGGSERYDSVQNGLMAAGKAKYILIHDGARPCITEKIISDSIDSVKKYRACTVGVPVKDTIKTVGEDGYAKDTPDRSKLWQIQTPQSFDASLLRFCYDMMSEEKPAGITDDTMLVERYTDIRTKVIFGAYENIKITTPEDVKIAENFLKKVVDTKTVR